MHPKLCDELVNNDYNSFLTGICDILECGTRNSALEFAECFASAFGLYYQLEQISISPNGVLKQLQLLDRSKVWVLMVYLLPY